MSDEWQKLSEEWWEMNKKKKKPNNPLVTLRATASASAKFPSILQEKPTFSILHIHFYKISTSVYLFYTFIQ